MCVKDEEAKDEEKYDETGDNCVESSLLPIKGTFVHPNIHTGFKYLVRNEDTEKLMFQVSTETYPHLSNMTFFLSPN